MNRRGSVIIGMGIAVLLAAPRLALGQRCPFQSQIWFQMQRQQTALMQTPTYWNMPNYPQRYTPQTGYNYRPNFDPSLISLYRPRVAVPRSQYTVPQTRERTYSLSSPLVRRTTFSESLVSTELKTRLTVTPDRVTWGGGPGPGWRSPLESTLMRRTTEMLTSTRTVSRTDTRVRLVKWDLFTREKVRPVPRLSVPRDTPLGRQPRIPRTTIRESKKTLVPRNSVEQAEKLTKPSVMVQQRPKLQLQVRMNFTCGRCHLGGGRPVPSTVSVPQTPKLPDQSFLLRILLQGPRSSINLPGFVRPPESVVALPVLPSPLKILPSVVGANNPYLLSRTLPWPWAPRDLTPSSTSPPETFKHPPVEPVSEPSPSPEETALRPPPLPPLPESAVQFPELPRTPADMVREPEAPPPVKLVVSRPPPLPPLPESNS
jgi:hypothetical protein